MHDEGSNRTDPCVAAAISVKDVVECVWDRFNWFSADQFVCKKIDYLDQELSGI